MPEKFTSMLTTGGERSVLLVGWQVKAVFIEPDHAELSELVATLLNQRDTESARQNDEMENP